MTIDYSSLLTDAQKRQLVENRLQQFASEAYQYSLNKKTAEEIQNEEQVKQQIRILKFLKQQLRFIKKNLQHFQLLKQNNSHILRLL